MKVILVGIGYMGKEYIKSLGKQSDELVIIGIVNQKSNNYYLIILNFVSNMATRRILPINKIQ